MCADEGILACFGGVFFAGKHAEAELEDSVLVLFHEEAESVVIAILSGFNPSVFRGRNLFDDWSCLVIKKVLYGGVEVIGGHFFGGCCRESRVAISRLVLGRVDFSFRKNVRWRVAVVLLGVCLFFGVLE